MFTSLEKEAIGFLGAEKNGELLFSKFEELLAKEWGQQAKTSEKVKVACHIMVLTGEKPTTYRIRQIIGGVGSNTTIQNAISSFWSDSYLMAFSENKSHSHKMFSSVSAPEAVITGMQGLWTLAIEHADKIYAEEKKKFQQIFDEKDAQALCAESAVKRLESELAEANRKNDSLAEQIAESKEIENELHGHLNDAQKTIDELESDLEKLSQALREETAHCAQTIAEMDVRAKQSVERIEESYAGLRHHLLQETDKIRDDLKASIEAELSEQRSIALRESSAHISTQKTLRDKTKELSDLKILMAKQEKDLDAKQVSIDVLSKEIERMSEMVKLALSGTGDRSRSEKNNLPDFDETQKEIMIDTIKKAYRNLIADHDEDESLARSDLQMESIDEYKGEAGASVDLDVRPLFEVCLNAILKTEEGSQWRIMS